MKFNYYFYIIFSILVVLTQAGQKKGESQIHKHKVSHLLKQQQHNAIHNKRNFSKLSIKQDSNYTFEPKDVSLSPKVEDKLNLPGVQSLLNKAEKPKKQAQETVNASNTNKNESNDKNVRFQNIKENQIPIPDFTKPKQKNESVIQLAQNQTKVENDKQMNEQQTENNSLLNLTNNQKQEQEIQQIDSNSTKISEVDSKIQQGDNNTIKMEQLEVNESKINMDKVDANKNPAEVKIDQQNNSSNLADSNSSLNLKVKQVEQDHKFLQQQSVSQSNSSGSAQNQNVSSGNKTKVQNPAVQIIPPEEQNSTQNDVIVDQNGNVFESVQLVNKISPKAKDDLVQLDDPLKAASNLIGKPYYMENNMTFDETPKIFSDTVDPQLMNADLARSGISKIDLWGWGNQTNYPPHLDDVAFKNRNSATGEIYNNPEVQTIVRSNDVPVFQDVEIKNEKQKAIDPLNDVYNPVKKVVFEKKYKHERNLKPDLLFSQQRLAKKENNDENMNE